MAATNRPDLIDPALLRPGRYIENEIFFEWLLWISIWTVFAFLQDFLYKYMENLSLIKFLLLLTGLKNWCFLAYVKIELAR